MNKPIITYEWLLKHDACPDAVHEIGEEKWEAWLLSQTVEMTKAVLAVGANVHAFDGAALSRASVVGYVELARVLLAAGADPGACDGEAMKAAKVYRHTKIIEMLKTAYDKRNNNHN